MIQIAAISGSPVKGGNTEALLQEALLITENDPEIQKSFFYLSELEISGCHHCNWCIKHQTAEKYCTISDGMDLIYPALLRADVIILATPVHIGRMSGLISNLIDRLRVFAYGNFHSGKLKDKIGAALVVAFLRHGGLEMTLGEPEQHLRSFSNDRRRPGRSCFDKRRRKGKSEPGGPAHGPGGFFRPSLLRRRS